MMPRLCETSAAEELGVSETGKIGDSFTKKKCDRLSRSPFVPLAEFFCDPAGKVIGNAGV